jgi:hypothetical protein
MPSEHKRRRDPCAQRPQPRREGPDSWATPVCLIGALIEHALPELPTGAIWEPAAGDGRLAAAMRRAGRRVIASDLRAQDGVAPLDFLHDAAPDATRGAIVITNPPFHTLDGFIARGLGYLDCGRTQGLALLLRHDHLTAGSRVAALGRATREIHMNWRPRWIPGSAGQPRWAFAWIVWTKGPRRAPLYVAAARGSSDNSPKAARQLFQELRDLIENWDTYGYAEDVLESRCRSIGERLDALGGLSLMQEAYYYAPSPQSRPSACCRHSDLLGRDRRLAMVKPPLPGGG